MGGISRATVLRVATFISLDLAVCEVDLENAPFYVSVHIGCVSGMHLNGWDCFWLCGCGSDRNYWVGG